MLLIIVYQLLSKPALLLLSPLFEDGRDRCV